MKTFFASKTSRLTTPLGWLFVYLLLVQGTLPSLVLCFGSGGHIAVETPHSPASHPTPQSQGPCLDVFLHVEKPEEHTSIVAPGAASHTLIPVLAHAAAATKARRRQPQLGGIDFAKVNRHAARIPHSALTLQAREQPLCRWL